MNVALPLSALHHSCTSPNYWGDSHWDSSFLYFVQLKQADMVALADPTAVKVYTVNGAASGSSSSLPDWLTRKRAVKGKGKRNAVREQVESTIELIQHFEFPEASNRVKTTRDGHHAIATGTYKPQIRVWDLDQLSLKFERHTDAENVDFVVSKSACVRVLSIAVLTVTFRCVDALG